MSYGPIYFYPVERMGARIGRRKVLLSETFLKKRLGATQRDGLSGGLINRVKSVLCPFCKVNLLELEEVGHDHQAPMTLNYKYVCLNTRCGAKFFGKCSWGN